MSNNFVAGVRFSKQSLNGKITDICRPFILFTSLISKVGRKSLPFRVTWYKLESCIWYINVCNISEDEKVWPWPPLPAIFRFNVVIEPCFTFFCVCMFKCFCSLSQTVLCYSFPYWFICTPGSKIFFIVTLWVLCSYFMTYLCRWGLSFSSNLFCRLLSVYLAFSGTKLSFAFVFTMNYRAMLDCWSLAFTLSALKHSLTTPMLQFTL